MIKTKQDLHFYLQEDLKWRNGKKPSLKDWLYNSEWWHIWKFHNSLRRYEYYENNKDRGIVYKCLWFYHKLMHHRLCTKLNIRIWPNTIGPGLYIPHMGTIFVSFEAEIGRNFIIRPGCCIGHIKSSQKGKTVIGDDVELSLGVKMFGNVKIGRGAVLNGNAVITQRVPPYAIVMGNPCKVVGFRMQPEEIVEYEKEHYQPEERLPLDTLQDNYDKYYTKRIKDIKAFVK